jgi:hypothetical protein
MSLILTMNERSDWCQADGIQYCYKFSILCMLLLIISYKTIGFVNIIRVFRLLSSIVPMDNSHVQEAKSMNWLRKEVAVAP